MRALLLLLPLAACAAPPGDFPSLAPRPIEQRSDAEPETVVVTAAPDPALDAKIADLLKQVETGAAAFNTAADRIGARLPAARSGGVGSDAWVDAQTAISQLLPSREAISGAQADLEQLAIDRAAAGQPPYPALERAKQTVTTAATTQRARYEELVAALPSP